MHRRSKLIIHGKPTTSNDSADDPVDNTHTSTSALLQYGGCRREDTGTQDTIYHKEDGGYSAELPALRQLVIVYFSWGVIFTGLGLGIGRRSRVAQPGLFVRRQVTEGALLRYYFFLPGLFIE